MPDRSGSADPSAMGEDTHSSRPIRWPGFSSTAKVSAGSSACIRAQTSPPATPGRIIPHQAEIACT